VESKQPKVRYLHIHEGDALDEKQLAAWVKQAIKLPGWGAATGVVREGGTAVWRGGAFIPGAVEGIVGAEAAAGGGGVVLTLSGSGAFAFTGEGPAGQSAPQRHAACAPWAPATSPSPTTSTSTTSTGRWRRRT
jgi:hypothetical protein